MNKVSIVIPVYNQLKMTIDCINDVLKTSEVEIEIIVVDDGSKEPVARAIAKVFPNVKVFRNDSNLGFAKTVNRGISNASNQYILLLNNDIKIKNPRWLGIMLNDMEKYSLDLAAPAGGRMDDRWNYIPGEAKKRGEKFAYLVGWCLLVKRAVFDKIGLMPENFDRGFFEDVLFGYRAKKAGFNAGIVEGTGVEHLYHKTFKAEGFNIAKEYENKRAIFLDIIKEEK